MDGSPYRQIREKNYNTVAEGGHPVASGLSVLMSQCPGVPFFQCPGVPVSRIRSVPDLHNSLHRLPLRYIPCFAASSGEEEPSIEDTGSRNNDQDEHEEGDSDEEYVTGGAVAEEEKLCGRVFSFHSLFLGSQRTPLVNLQNKGKQAGTD